MKVRRAPALDRLAQEAAADAAQPCAEEFSAQRVVLFGLGPLHAVGGAGGADALKVARLNIGVIRLDGRVHQRLIKDGGQFLAHGRPLHFRDDLGQLFILRDVLAFIAALTHFDVDGGGIQLPVIHFFRTQKRRIKIHNLCLPCNMGFCMIL